MPNWVRSIQLSTCNIFLERDESLFRENRRIESDVRNYFGDVILAGDAVFDRTDLHTVSLVSFAAVDISQPLLLNRTEVDLQ